jgi:hypothetical protein
MAPHLEPGSLKQAAEIGLRKMKQGNARFVRGEARFPTVCAAPVPGELLFRP